MVTKVYGLANGVEVIFSPTANGQWEITVPWSDDGKYTAEIFAEDEAGNLSHLCSMLFVISGHELQTVIVQNDISAQIKTQEIMAELQNREMMSVVKELNMNAEDQKENKYSVELLQENITSVIQKGGYKVECIICGNSSV